MRNALLAVMLLALPAAAAAQATLTPSFNAPYRAFERHEFGGTVSFPKNSDYGIEGQYRFGYENLDIGLRGGIVKQPATATFPKGATVTVLGLEGRTRGFSHTDNFPLDGSLIVGFGARLFHATDVAGNAFSANSGVLLAGFSLGRRIESKTSPISVVPYAQPSVYLQATSSGTTSHFTLGLGADVRLSKLIDARFSLGLGDLQGIAFSLVWVH